MVANNPKFRKMKPIHNRLGQRRSADTVANNPKFRKMKPIHNPSEPVVTSCSVANNPKFRKKWIDSVRPILRNSFAGELI